MEEINNISENDSADEGSGILEGMPPPDIMVVYPNPEKNGRIRLGQEEYMPYITSRILLSGPPGSGKRNVILNLIRRIVPPPSVCHLVHHDPNSIEYDVLSEWGIPVITYGPQDFPTLKNLDDPWGHKEAKKAAKASDDSATSDDEDDKIKTLDNPIVVVDEVTADAMGKKGCHRFERMVNHACTHRNTTLLCSIQSAASIPACVRRGFNHFALWKQPDDMLNKMLARRSGMKPDMLEDLFELLENPHEFIWVDLDSDWDSPWRYRLGLMSPIQITPS